MTPARCRSLSVSVVLPASTWARMPRLSERAGMCDPLRVATEELGVRACCSHLRAISWDQWPGLPVSVTIRRATRRSPTLSFGRRAASVSRVGSWETSNSATCCRRGSYSPLWTIHGARRTGPRVLNALALAGPCPPIRRRRPRTANRSPFDDTATARLTDALGWSST